MKRVLAVFVLAALSGCTQPQPVISTPAFNPSEAKFALRHGRNVIEGQAAMLRPDGQIASCAGEFATLVPVTRYTQERLARIYRNGNAAPFATAPRLPKDPNFENYIVRSNCDPAGRFRFADLADGRYFVVAPLRGVEEGPRDGVSVRTKVSLHGGQTRTVQLPPNGKI